MIEDTENIFEYDIEYSWILYQLNYLMNSSLRVWLSNSQSLIYSILLVHGVCKKYKFLGSISRCSDLISLGVLPKHLCY